MIEIVICVAYGLACLIGIVCIVVTLKKHKEDGV